MSGIEFFAFLVEHWDIYIYSLILCLVIYFFTYRKTFISLLDPLNLNILFSCLGASVVFFLFFTGEINWYYFSSFCLTQIAFTIGFFVFKPIKINLHHLGSGKRIKIQDELLFLEIIFIISTQFNLLSQLYVYAVRGIPLFMESYLDTYGVGGGFGILSRIITASSIISWYLLIHFLLNKKGKGMKIYLYTYMIISLVFFSLNGSKGTFLTIGLTLFLYTLINYRFNEVIQNLQKKIEGFSKKFFALICVMVIAIISFKSANGANPFIDLGIRLVSSGDAYFFGYPNDVLQNLPPANGFYAVFSDLLGMLRLVSWENLPQSFGMTLLRYHSPGVEVIAGANARHNIFGLFYFGYFGSIIFSFTLGILLSFCRNFLYYRLPKNILFGLFYVLLYFSIVTVEADVCLALFMLDSYVLGLLLIFVLAFIFFFMYKFTIVKPHKQQIDTA